MGACLTLRHRRQILSNFAQELVLILGGRRLPGKLQVPVRDTGFFKGIEVAVLSLRF